MPQTVGVSDEKVRSHRCRRRFTVVSSGDRPDDCADCAVNNPASRNETIADVAFDDDASSNDVAINDVAFDDDAVIGVEN